MSALEVRKASPVDDAILRWADSLSPEEISASVGGIVSAKAIAARTQTLLKAKDWLTDAQEDQLVTLRMKEMVANITSSDYKYLDVKLRALIALGDRIDSRRKATDVDLNTLYGNQALIMARVYDIALSYMRGALREKIDPEVWDATAEEALLVAKGELAKHQAVES